MILFYSLEASNSVESIKIALNEFISFSGNMGAEKTARARGESSARRLDASSNTSDVSTRRQEKDQRKQPLTQSVKLHKTAHAQGESSARCPAVSSDTSDVASRGQEQDQRMQPQMQSVQLQKTRLFQEIRDLLCSELKKGRQLANFQHAALEKLIQDNTKCFPMTSLRCVSIRKVGFVMRSS